MAAVHLTAENFENEVVKSEVPVLVDFWAEWCGPCKMVAPIVDEIAGELEGRMKVAKLNVDEAQELAAKYNIMSIPTLLLFKQGDVIDMMVGAMAKDQMLAKITPNLEASA